MTLLPFRKRPPKPTRLERQSQVRTRLLETADDWAREVRAPSSSHTAQAVTVNGAGDPSLVTVIVTVQPYNPKDTTA